MSDAIARMASYLAGAEPWRPDRDLAKGPPVRQVLIEPLRKRVDVSPGMRSRILSALQRGPATGEQIAARMHCLPHSVNAKLSRLYREGFVDRAPDARSPHNGRLVQVYKLK